MSVKAVRRSEIWNLPEPRKGFLAACKIPAGTSMMWQNRMYAGRRGVSGRWSVDFGTGSMEPLGSWDNVLRWFKALAPHDIEWMEVE